MAPRRSSAVTAAAALTTRSNQPARQAPPGWSPGRDEAAARPVRVYSGRFRNATEAGLARAVASGSASAPKELILASRGTSWHEQPHVPPLTIPSAACRRGVKTSTSPGPIPRLGSVFPHPSRGQSGARRSSAIDLRALFALRTRRGDAQMLVAEIVPARASEEPAAEARAWAARRTASEHGDRLRRDRVLMPRKIYRPHPRRLFELTRPRILEPVDRLVIRSDEHRARR